MNRLSIRIAGAGSLISRMTIQFNYYSMHDNETTRSLYLDDVVAVAALPHVFVIEIVHQASHRVGVSMATELHLSDVGALLEALLKDVPHDTNRVELRRTR